MIGYLRRLNVSLPGLVLGIVLYGLAVEIIVLAFVPGKLFASIGLWYGVAIAIGMAVNLASVIYDSVSLGNSDAAQKRAVFMSMLRYGAVVVLFFLLGILKFGNLYLAVIGVMGLKISAYLQPLMAKLCHKWIGDHWMYPIPRDPEEECTERS